VQLNKWTYLWQRSQRRQGTLHVLVIIKMAVVIVVISVFIIIIIIIIIIKSIIKMKVIFSLHTP
jgi:hypothetical protein